MSGRTRLAAALLLVLLAGLLAYLFVRTQASDLGAQDRVVFDLRELEKLDAEWNVNILRSHIGLNPNYDPLTAPLPRIHTLQARLRAALVMVRDPGAPAAYETLRRALAEKEELVEQFKSHNAVLRNSLIYFPPAITDLKTELTGIEGATVPARTVLALDAALNELLTDILRYNLAPDRELAQHIEQTIEAMLAHRDAFSPAVAETIDELARHARTILRYRQLENTLEARIKDTRTVEALDKMSAVFDRAFDQVAIEKQRFRTYLFAYSGLLLVLLAYAAWRLRRSYRIIGVVNQRLRAANETLELRVAERTAELEAQSARLEQLAQHDSLTGLINYGQLTQQLEHALVRAGRRDTIVVVMFIDLDGFKAVNDTYGHATGDLVLKEVARRVQGQLRREDSLARLGGDEFVILLEEVSSREGARRVAQQTLDQIGGITEAGGHPVRISASIGIGSACGKAGAQRGAAALLAEADQAMYQAKAAGKNGYAFSPQAQWESCKPTAGNALR
ncbi:MAG TPA: DAHL domain-containing protein [Telluria sp.]|nr:DAHL domain-containing protein [Telluria sp.]